jgi:L-alanine-DL-glutamate epimerase-like enolase superfamily enzyme
MNKREFIKSMGLMGVGASIVANPIVSCAKNEKLINPKHKLKLSFKPYDLQLKHVFKIATNSRTTTAIMVTKIEYGDFVGYGEASMPPYLGESHETATKFLSKVNLEQFDNPFELETILSYVDKIAPKNAAAKASVDIALHDLIGKMLNQPMYNVWGFNHKNTPFTSYTIGIDKPEVVRQKVKEANRFAILKIKLGGDNDKEMINTVREITDKPICVDVNQGWKTKEHALEMCKWLAERNCKFVEQPMPKTDIEGMTWLTKHSPLPTIADEAIQRLEDVVKAYKVYSGVNIKLMKCTGMREAHKMITLARALDMKVMLGCMVESSCAIAAGAHLSTMVDWADLDGNLLINNDIFKGTTVKKGQIILNDKPGLGIEPLKNIF